MKHRLHFALAAALAATSLSFAQERPTDPKPTDPNKPAVNPRDNTPRDNARPAETVTKTQLHRISKLIGVNVKNKAGESLGEIKDFALSVNDDQIAYVVLGSGGILSIGGKYLAIPWGAFEFSNVNNVAVLNVDKATLEAAPGFDKDAWPNFADETWATSVFKHYKQRPYWESRDETGRDALPAKTNENKNVKNTEHSIVKATDAIGMNVENAKNENLGDIQDIVMELKHGRIAYAVLGFGGVMGVGDKLFAVPWQAFDFTVDDRKIGSDAKLVLNVEKDKLKTAPGFDKSKWPDMTDEQWVKNVHMFYGQEPTWVYGYSNAGSTRDNATPGTRDNTPGARDNTGARDDMYKGFNFKNTETIRGKVTEVQAPAGAEGVVLLVQETGKDKACKVHVAPARFISTQGVTLDAGDDVTLKGTKGMLNGEEIIVLKEISIDGKTIKLRDDNGHPVWAANR
jgi:sporulation protein YlmC with PRC-barrel domain